MKFPANFRPNSERATSDEITHALKVDRFAAVAGLIFFAIGCYLAYRLFAPLVPPTYLRPWAIGTALFLILWLGIDLVFLFRSPSTRELIKIWAPTAKIVLIGSNFVVVGSIWLLRPHVEQILLLTMMIFYCCHVSTQILASPENTEVNRFGIVLVLGSAITFLMFHGEVLETAIALFLVCYAVFLYFACNIVRDSMRGAVTARLASEATARELELAVAEVSKERDAKTRFIAAASHDLGQPLQAANLFFDQAIRARDDESRARAAEGVLRSFAAADQLLSHMLNHLRLEADAVEPHLSEIDLGRCFERIRAQYQPLAKQNKIHLGAARCRLTLRLDPALLDRAIGNLVQNALVHSGATRVLLGCHRIPGERARIYVLDNGVGVGSADARHIFNDFYQGSDSRAVTKGGFGLGLSSTRRLVQLMDGVAELDQRWARGAAFYLEFPRTI
jgi:two-component system, sensor histidine kinase